MRYYVYKLIDPRDGHPFYVGKGCDDRIEAHEKEAACGSNHPKCLVIRGIWEEGLEVGREIVARFYSERDAYEFEARLIDEIGLVNLTNLQPGGGGVSGPEANLEHAETALARMRRSADPKSLESILSKQAHWGQLSPEWQEVMGVVLSTYAAVLGEDVVVRMAREHGIEVRYGDE